MDDNVVRLVDRASHPVGGNAGFADWLHSWADGIASGDYGDIGTLIVLVERADGVLGKISQAAKPLDHARFVGLLALAIHRSETNALDMERLQEP